MLLTNRFTWAALFLVAMLCGPACLSGQELDPDPVYSEPVSYPAEYYRKRGLLPSPNGVSSDGKRVARTTDGSWSLTSATRTLTAPGSYELDLLPVSRVSNNRVVIANVGDVPVANPWVVANNSRDWFSCASIVQEALGAETNPELKAFRNWDLVRRGRYHWYPAEAGLEVHSPVKYLNVYGYGFCDDSATNLELLWRLSGFPNSRCYGISGHVVSEVYYGGGWHVLDADLEVFYPLWTGTGAAGTAQLVADGGLVGRVTPEFEAFYTSSADNSYYVGWWDSSSSMVMTLRPGESLERCHYNWGKHHDNLYHQPPPFYGNGRQTWAPDLTVASRSAPGFSDLSNISWNAVANDSVPLLHPTDPAQPASLAWTMTSAYVFVGGSVEFDLRAAGAATSAELHFRKPGEDWQLLGAVSSPHDGWTSVSLDAAVAPLSSDACYSFDLKLVLVAGSGGAASDIGLNALSTTGDIQCNPRSLPVVVSGQINQIATTFSPAQGAQLEVTFEWDQRNDLEPFGVPSAPIAPVSGASVTTTAPELTWDSVHGDNPNLWREVMVSLDPNGYRPAAPFAWTEGPRENSWSVPDGWLNMDATYYWRVREGDALSDWSSAWSFIAQQPTPVSISGWSVE